MITVVRAGRHTHDGFFYAEAAQQQQHIAPATSGRACRLFSLSAATTLHSLDKAAAADKSSNLNFNFAPEKFA